ncbi:Glutaredoxin [Marasmius tenuissimus]|nr:Glutaredoxin [Marasmius tenuissimus]
MSFLNRFSRFFSCFSSPSPAQVASTKDLVETAIQENRVLVFSKSYCPYCQSTKHLFRSNFPDAPAKVIELDRLAEGSAIQAYLLERTGQRTVPNIFVNQQHVGGNDSARAMHKTGELEKLVNT